MKRNIQLLVLLLLTLSMEGFGQIYRTDYINGNPYNYWYTLHEGTASHRRDSNWNPAMYVDTLHLGTYYGAPVGRSTGTTFNTSNHTSFGRSSGFIDLALYQANLLSKIDERSDVEFIAKQPWGYDLHKMNVRLARPHKYLANPTGTEKYPLIVMMHGRGETAYCNNGCLSEADQRKYNNDHNLYHGAREQLDAINRPEGDPRHWPGFALFPQNSNGWGLFPSNNVHYVVRTIELLLQKYPIDPYRIYIHGLSNGGQGSYLLLYEHPELIAAAAPMSGTDVAGYSVAYGYNPQGGLPNPYPIVESIVHVPIWQFQGGTDTSPTPASTEQRVKVINDAGGSVQYTRYEGRGHSIWGLAYAEPDFFSWFLQYSKLKIHSYFGIDEICDGSTIRMGVTHGFMAYEWQQSTNGGSTWNTYQAIPGRPHEIDATEAGLYRVRITRDAGNGVTVVPEVSEWSEPFNLKHREPPVPVINTNGSWVLFGLNNNTSLNLISDFDDAEHYQWFRNGAPYANGADLSQITLNQFGEGIYTLQYEDNFCTSIISEPVYINRAPTDGGEPAAPTNLQGAPTGENTSTIWWNDNATNEIGYEIYRSLNGTNYVWLGNFEENLVTYNDTGLTGGQTVWYKVRAFNEHGASSEASVVIEMPEDINPPAVPENFSFIRFGVEEIRLNPRPLIRPDLMVDITIYDETYRVHLDSALFSWNRVPDGSQITYDIYSSEGILIGSTQDTSYVVSDLIENESYSFYVRARDASNLVSAKSQTASLYTAMNGLTYLYYQGAIWDFIADYSFHPVTGQGRINNFIFNHPREDDYFAYDFIGFIRFDQSGTWRFRTTSNDGSSLWIANTRVVTNDDGVRENATARTGQINISSPGIYPITVKYYERVGDNSLNVEWDRPGGSTSAYVPIPDAALTSTTLTAAAPPGPPSNLSATANGYEIDLSWDHPMEDIHVVVLGSSTAAGQGATSYSNSWAGQFDQALENLNNGNSVSNLAVNGYTSYHLKPTGSSVPGGRPSPNPAANITAALAQNPDVIIVNLPSNDRANGYNLDTETIPNLIAIRNAATAAGVPIYFTTTQPRNDLSESNRLLLQTERDRIIQNFNGYAINIYNELANPDGTIKTIYSAGDNVHLNNAGHSYLYNTIWNKVSGQSIPVFEIFRSDAGGAFHHELSTNKQQVTITDEDLNASILYQYQVRAATSTGVSAFTNVAGATTSGDTEPPTIPGNFRLATATESQITILWDASTDNVRVDHYVVADASGGASGGKINVIAGKEGYPSMGQTNLTSLTLTGLTPMETYELTVFAVDPSGNESGISNVISVQTQAPLPVEFLDVTHKVTENGILVMWATASELNNAYFTVERGTGLDDFEEIGGVDGSGTTSSRRDYTFLDRNPLDLAYYRIKQTDFDGMYEYSKIIRVVYNDSNLEEFTVYPNPTNQQNINARGYVPAVNSSVQVKMLDVMGRTHMVKVLDPNEFLDGVKIDLDYAVPPGVYIIQISDGANSTQRRVVIR